MPASYPTAAKTFATITNATTSDAAQINEPREEITAIEQDLIAGLPVARGGTGLTSAGSAGQIPISTGSAYVLTSLEAEQTDATTGAQNNVNLSARFTVLRCTGAEPIFSGFTVNSAAPQAGDTVRIVCLGTSVRVTTQDNNSTAANRIICPSTNGQIVGLNGTITLVYDDTTDRWRQTAVEPGAWLVAAYAAGNFTGSGGQTWGVDDADEVVTYQQRGNTLAVTIQISGSDVGGVANPSLVMTVPGGFTATRAITTANLYIENAGGAGEVGILSVNGTSISFVQSDSANWTGTATDNTTCKGQIVFEVN